MNDWKLWGDTGEPVAVGTEEEVKRVYSEKAADDAAAATELYIEDPHGNEFEHDGRRWISVG